METTKEILSLLLNGYIIILGTIILATSIVTGYWCIKTINQMAKKLFRNKSI